MDVGSVLTLALLGVYLALRPWSVFAAILLATSRGGVVKDAAYSCGWMFALSAIAVATVLFYPQVPKTSDTRTGLAVSEVVFGIGLALLLLYRWRHPSHPGTASQPSWMTRLDDVSPVFAFALGAFLPSYIVVFAAVTEMLNGDMTTGWLAVTAALWVLLASSGVMAPLVVRVVRADRATDIYQQWRAWIVAHTRALLFATGALVSLVLIGKGLAKLLA